MKKRTKKKVEKSTATARPEVIEDLEGLKAADEPDTEFYAGLEAHRAEIVSDLEAMLKNDEEKKSRNRKIPRF